MLVGDGEGGFKACPGPSWLFGAFEPHSQLQKALFKMPVTPTTIQGPGDTVGLKHLRDHHPSLCAPSLGGKWEPVPAHSLPLSRWMGPLGFLVPQALLQSLGSVGAVGACHCSAGWNFFLI